MRGAAFDHNLFSGRAAESQGVLKNLDQYTKPNPEVKKMREDFDNRQKAQRAAIAAEKAAKEAAKDDK